jgi:hypothetical protein
VVNGGGSRLAPLVSFMSSSVVDGPTIVCAEVNSVADAARPRLIVPATVALAAASAVLVVAVVSR